MAVSEQRHDVEPAARRTRKIGRPTKLTPEVQERIVKGLRIGNWRETAAAAAGIEAKTLRNWLKRGARARSGPFRAFLDAVLQAEAEAELQAVLALTSAAQTDWRAALEWLQRKAPQRWSARLNVKLESELERLLDVCERVLAPEVFATLLGAIAAEDGEEATPEDPGDPAD